MGNTQIFLGLIPTLHSEIIPGKAGRLSGVLRIKPRSNVCKTNTLPTYYAFAPYEKHFKNYYLPYMQVLILFLVLVFFCLGPFPTILRGYSKVYVWRLLTAMAQGTKQWQESIMVALHAKHALNLLLSQDPLIIIFMFNQIYLGGGLWTCR